MLLNAEEKEPEQHKDSLIQRLIRRHVVQTAAIYVAVAWGAVEILITLQEKLGWPEFVSIWATRLFVAGFPLAVILSWKRDLKNRAARFALISVALLAASVALWLTFSTNPVPRAPSTNLQPINEVIATVAILPFENGTGDPSFDYLAKGFTGELIGRLSKHPDLAVIQEESAASPMLASLIPAAMASTLKADYLVQGRVLREDKFIEVTANLQDPYGKVLWSDVMSEPYSADSIISMQRRISGEVSRILGTKLESQAFCGETSDLDAMELYFRGRLKTGTRKMDSIKEGIELLKQATRIDPYFGRAWNQLGSGQLVLAGRMDDRQQASVMSSMAISAYRRALDICPTLGAAYKILVPPYEGVDNNSIDQELQWRDALPMDPNDAGLLRQYAFHLMNHGKNKEAIAAMQRAYDDEPMMAMIPAQLAHALSLAGRCDEALPLAVEGEKLGGTPSAAIEIGCAFQAGDVNGYVSATEELAEAMTMINSPTEAMNLSPEEFAHASIEYDHPLRPAMSKRMRELWRENTDVRQNKNVYWIIGVATEINDFDLVFEILNSLVEPWGFASFTVAYSPLFDSKSTSSRLRADPRFVELIQQTSYPDYWREFGWPEVCRPQGDSFVCF